MDNGFAELLSPKIDPKDPLRSVSIHLGTGDYLLAAIIDVANLGIMNDDLDDEEDPTARYLSILEMVKLYRAGMVALDKALPRGHVESMKGKPKGKAA